VHRAGLAKGAGKGSWRFSNAGVSRVHLGSSGMKKVKLG